MAALALTIQSEADLKNVKITFPQEKSLSVVKKKTLPFTTGNAFSEGANQKQEIFILYEACVIENYASGWVSIW